MNYVSVICFNIDEINSAVEVADSISVDVDVSVHNHYSMTNFSTKDSFSVSTYTK